MPFQRVVIALCWALGAGASAAQSPPIRICDQSGCRVQAADQVPVDPEEAARPAREDLDAYAGEPLPALEAAAKNGDAIAAYKLGVVSQFGAAGRRVDEAQAAQFYEMAAAKDHVWAEYRLASLLTTGRTLRHDPVRAQQLFFAAAKGGNPASANNIGLAYLNGIHLPKDKHQAVRWLTIAAEAGVAEAQYNVGVLYLRGEAEDQDLYQGLKWTKAAADHGQLGAKKVLGRIYMTGMNNVSQDIGQAKHWLEPVAVAGDPEARAWVREIVHTQEVDAAHAKEMQKQNAEAFKFLAGVALSAAFAPPPVYLVHASAW